MCAHHASKSSTISCIIKLSAWSKDDKIKLRDIGFHSLTDNIETHSSGGKLLFHILGAIAEFEAALISERTKSGLAVARKNGKRIGRPRRLNVKQVKRAKLLLDTGNHSMADIASQLKVGKTTLWRNLRNEADIQQ